MNKFEIGDTIRREGSNHHVADGGIYIVRKLLDRGYIELQGFEDWGYNSDNFKLVRSKGKQPKEPEKKLHLTVQDDCCNIIGNVVADNLEEAKDFDVEGGKTYTIYELVPVYKVEMSKKFTKVKTTPKKIKRRKK